MLLPGGSRAGTGHRTHGKHRGAERAPPSRRRRRRPGPDAKGSAHPSFHRPLSPKKAGRAQVGFPFWDDRSGDDAWEGLGWLRKAPYLLPFQDIGGRFKLVKRESKAFIYSLYRITEREQPVKQERPRFYLGLPKCHGDDFVMIM